jgi:hypothetical protein
MNRNQMRICAGLSGIVLGGILAFVTHTRTTGAEREDNMLQATQPLPPMDKMAPAKTETATFALG